MTPYYQDESCTIYHGDCREILPHLPKVDLVCTDPPYGIEIGVDNNQTMDSSHLAKQGYASYADTYLNFVSMIVPALNYAISSTGRATVFSGPHIHEQRKPNSIGGIIVPCATGRTPWGSKNFLPILFYGTPPLAGQHRPTVLTSTETSEPNGHPVPKPIGWLLWLVSIASSPSETILDPFMGSGTTLVAAKQLGRKAIGIEICKAYCEIAAKRLRNTVTPLIPIEPPTPNLNDHQPSLL